MKKIFVLTLLFIGVTVIVHAEKPIELELSTQQVDLQTIPMRPRSEKNITLYNRSDKPIVIKSITVDCNCIKFEWKKSPLMANDSTAIKIIYTPSEKGVFYKKAKVITTAGNYEVVIRGTVK